MTHSSKIRDSFRNFFKKHGHEVVHSASVIPQNDPTLIFANAGMVPFKDVFTGQDTRPYKRATSAQKCIRISGKHNDLENVGVTARHHTFFEMLGNFSFGDYFKEAAISYAWELFSKEWQLDSQRLVVTVFAGESGLPADDEAAGLWRKISGLPDSRILRLGAADNFWQMGDTGPCGPCSEIHYFFGDGEPDLSLFGKEPGADGRGWVELWNLVFMQFERQVSGELNKLPAPSIDTGMGLERISCVLQNVVSNYDTDLLRPIVDLTADIAGKRYGGTLGEDDVSMRVIADHARTTAFLISEGVFPDRAERSYVLRRVMRRAIRHGHRLGIERLFLHECALAVADAMSGEYPELRERRALIGEIAQQEETRFRQTLKRGLERLNEAVSGIKHVADGSESQGSASGAVQTSGHADLSINQISGALAFELYDTYGFPFDLQEVLAQEHGLAIDKAGFEAELEKARERSAGSKLGEEAIAGVYRKLAAEFGGTQVEFLGYDAEQAEAELVGIAVGNEVVQQITAGQAGVLVTRQTPFYGESGGQVGDRGSIELGEARFVVTDTQKPVAGLVVHIGQLERGSLSRGQTVKLRVDRATRSATRRNHSATHLLHLALRKVVGPHAMQKGSRVGPESLRFDYSSGSPLTDEQIAQIEQIVNERILLNVAVTTDVLPMAEAKARGAIGIFEEKYGETVRMLSIADSLELCGGTHVARTGDIGAFKILSDAGIAAGVRRIEATTGFGALGFVDSLQRELSRTAELLKATPLTVFERTEKLIAQRKELQREIEQLKKQLLSGGSKDLTQLARNQAGVNVLGATVEIADPGALRTLADQLRDKLAPAVVVLGAKQADDKVLLVCTVSKELTKQWKAGALIKEIAALVSGSGGGRPDFAQAGGSDAARLPEAVERVYSLVTASA